MKTTLIGDFADPLSFLASQRLEQIHSLGLHDIAWLAVDGDRRRPTTGTPLAPETAEQVRRLSLPGEAVPTAGLPVPTGRAAAAAYGESVTDGVSAAMRRALFDALWVHGRNIADPDVIRSIVFAVLHPDPPAADIDWRIRANLPVVPLGSADPIVTGRQLGVYVSPGRSPLTRAGRDRIASWQRLWEQRGRPALPLLLTDLGEALTGEHALRWLACQLPHRDLPAPRGPVATAVVDAPDTAPRHRRPAHAS